MHLAQSALEETKIAKQQKQKQMIAMRIRCCTPPVNQAFASGQAMNITALAAARLAPKAGSMRRLAIGLGLISSGGLSLAGESVCKLFLTGNVTSLGDLSAARRRMKEGFRCSSTAVTKHWIGRKTGLLGANATVAVPSASLGASCLSLDMPPVRLGNSGNAVRLGTGAAMPESVTLSRLEHFNHGNSIIAETISVFRWVSGL
ncbi:MAG: hypothetical protein FRX49_13630 [Trebouxia sp. A1-2]|nr:MAG: hypothetical protein FRX49_13630 [Trebouxia sp. A1-2]